MKSGDRQRGAALWEQRFAELERYIRVVGDACIPKTSTLHKELREWLRYQQVMAVAGTLAVERWLRLTALGVTLLGNDERWQMRFAQLIEFKERFGHCRVPAKWEEDRPLARWFHAQREFKKMGKLSAMRISLLESVGFEWFARWPKSRDMHWDEMLGQLARFRQEHGHTEVPRGYQAVPRLAGWVSDQREAHRTGTMREDRAERLDAIGFAWKDTGISRGKIWEERFAQLLAYRERFGHCRVPAKWEENRPLGRWVEVQREFRKKGTIRDERIRRLDEISFVWQAAPNRHHP